MRISELSEYFKSRTYEGFLLEAAYGLLAQRYDPISSGTNLIHIAYARASFLKEEGRLDLIKHALMWDIALLFWSGDWMNPPGPIFEELAQWWRLEPPTQDDIALITSFDYMARERKVSKYILEAVAEFGVDPECNVNNIRYVQVYLTDRLLTKI